MLMLALIGLAGFGKAQEQTPTKKTSLIDDPINLTTRMVTLGVSVTDGHGHPISGLKPEDFEIIEDKTPQKIELFATEDSPLTIAIAIDRSGSMMINNKLQRALEAVTLFLNQSNPEDEFLLGLFNQKLEIV